MRLRRTLGASSAWLSGVGGGLFVTASLIHAHPLHELAMATLAVGVSAALAWRVASSDRSCRARVRSRPHGSSTGWKGHRATSGAIPRAHADAVPGIGSQSPKEG